VPKIKTLKQRRFDDPAAGNATEAGISEIAVPRFLAGTGYRRPKFASELRRERVEQFAIERAENEGMSVGDTEQAARTA